MKVLPFKIFTLSLLLTLCGNLALSQSLNWYDSFEKSGTKISSDYRHSGNGRAHQSTEVSHSGKQALKFELRSDRNDDFRDELVFNGGPLREMKNGSEWWIGFSLYVPKDWKPDPTGEIIWQSHRVPDNNDVDGGQPPQRLIVDGTSLSFREVWSGENPLRNRTRFSIDVTRRIISNIKPGTWYRFVMHFKWSQKSDGLSEVWVDNEKVYSRSGPNQWVDQKGLYMKWGIYKSLWRAKYNKKYQNQSQNRGIAKRTYFEDDFRIYIGTKGYNLVRPDQGTGPVEGLPNDQTPISEPVLLSNVRLNSGGANYKDKNGNTFYKDDHYDEESGEESANIEVASTEDDDLYKSHRSGKDFSYSIPVKNGTYDFVLHFAALKEKPIGTAVFDIDIENGAIVEKDYDIRNYARGMEATTLTFRNVEVDGERANIRFIASAGFAKVSAIEILEPGVLENENQAPVFALSGDLELDEDFAGVQKVLVTPGPVTSVEQDQVVLYSIKPEISQIANMSIDPLTGEVSFSALTGKSGIETFEITADDGQAENNTYAQSFTLTITSTQSGPSLIPIGQPTSARINAGSDIDMSFGGFVFKADHSFTSNSTMNSNTSIDNIGKTRFDDLYRTERIASTIGGTFGYNIPIQNGTYVVVAHFAEIYHSSSVYNGVGERVFNVEMEGLPKIMQQDIAREAGLKSALVKLIIVQVRDEELNIEFKSSVGQAQVAAIEVLSPNELEKSLIFQDEFNLESLSPELQELLAKNQNRLTVFPNPANGFTKVLLEGPAEGYFEMELYDAVGRRQMYQLMKKEDVVLKEYLPLKNLAPGIYFLSVKNEKFNLGQRLWITH